MRKEDIPCTEAPHELCPTYNFIYLLEEVAPMRPYMALVTRAQMTHYYLPYWAMKMETILRAWGLPFEIYKNHPGGTVERVKTLAKPQVRR